MASSFSAATAPKFLSESKFVDFNVFQTGMNFVPIEMTLVVAELGLKLFEMSCKPIGTTWFSKCLVVHYQYNKH